MELAIPIVALGSLYYATNQSKKTETFKSNIPPLPNTDVPNKNYPEEYPVQNAELERTSNLSVNNRYDTPYTYTDKYFNPQFNQNMVFPTTNTENAYSEGDKYSSTFTSLTGDRVDKSYFQHNNMVPFYKKNAHNQVVDGNSTEGMMDAMTGAGSLLYKKQEHSPLFKPSENTHHAYGMPSTTDFVQSRMNVGMKMSNVKPFEEIREAPGLNGQAAEGYNSGMMARETWMPRNVDELRTANNPKSSGLSMLGHEGPASSLIKKQGFLGKVEKNRPERTFDFTPDRYMTTTGAVKGGSLHSMPIDRHVTREGTARSHIGVAGAQNPSTYMEGEYMPSTRIELGELPLGVASAGGRQGAYDGDHGMRSNHVAMNNRSVDTSSDYYGAVGGAFGAVVAPLLDMLRPSRKENAIGTMRPYQNPKSEVASSYIFDPSDRPGTTIRETTEQSINHLNVNRGQGSGAYETTPHQIAFTNRNEVGAYNYVGASSAGDGQRQIRPYDAEYQSTKLSDKKTTQGYMAQGNMSLFQGEVNGRVKNDSDRVNKYSSLPNMPYQSPDITMMGKTNSNGGYNLYSNIGIDRNSPEMLDALKSNPYTHSVTNAFR
jgi:hypothetical protein